MKNILFSILFCLSLTCPILRAQTPMAEEYAWHFPAPDTIRTASDLIVILQEEVDKILQAGPLAPIRLAFGDLYWEQYFQYQEPGRILTTLAWAWPYMTPLQQASSLMYVENELTAPGRAPWSANYTLPRDQGTRRELYPSTNLYGVESNFGDYRPRLHTLYGFWLFCYRSGQTEWMGTYYEDIKAFYQNQHNRAKLYGDMNGHIAMARIAYYNDDDQQVNFAMQRLQEELEDGLALDHKHAFAQTGLAGWDAPYNRLPGSEMYDPRKDGLIYRGFIFLNMGPEVARFLKEFCFAQVDSMHQSGKRILPMWWLMQAPYFPRWTGDESIGVPTEAFGMYHPVETWIVEAPPQMLRRYMRSSPTGIGDCYWLEALVQTIEAHAVNTALVDVRDTDFPEVALDEGTTGEERIDAVNPIFTMTPNPARENVELQVYDWIGEIRWSARNMKGELIASGTAVAPTQISISLRRWPSGSYVCTIESLEGNLAACKILIIQ
jgi:hypothetical protein